MHAIGGRGGELLAVGSEGQAPDPVVGKGGEQGAVTARAQVKQRDLGALVSRARAVLPDGDGVAVRSHRRQAAESEPADDPPGARVPEERVALLAGGEKRSRGREGHVGVVLSADERVAPLPFDTPVGRVDHEQPHGCRKLGAVGRLGVVRHRDVAAVGRVRDGLEADRRRGRRAGPRADAPCSASRHVDRVQLERARVRSPRPSGCGRRERSSGRAPRRGRRGGRPGRSASRCAGR